jgi:hypothetical protein
MFSDAVLARLKALARSTKDDGCVPTDVAKTALGVSEPKWQRLAALKSFPKRRRVGRPWYINASALYDWAVYWNKLERGIPFTTCAPICHSTVATLRALFELGRFVEALGYIAGHPRFDEGEVRKWSKARLTSLRRGAGDVPAPHT